MDRLIQMDSNALVPLLWRDGEDCWNRSGVWGQETPRCSRLEEVVHCRNCDVFTQAGRRLFDSAANIEYSTEWADNRVSQRSQSTMDNHSYTVFRLADEWLAVSTRVVAEVCETGATHRIPHRNKNVLNGIMSVHGQLLPWLNLAALMGMPENVEQNAGSERCIVIEREQQAFVFSVAQVQGVMRVAAGEMRTAPAASIIESKQLIMGVASWSGHNVGCVDGEALFDACNECLL